MQAAAGRQQQQQKRACMLPPAPACQKNVKRAAFGTGLELLLLAAFTSVAGAPSWSGPATRLLPSGRLRITPVSSAAGPLETTPASWVAVNAPLRRVWHNSSEGWDTFDLQLRLARQSGVRVLSMVLNEWEFAEPSTDPATLASRAYALQGVRRAVAVWPEVYLMLRLALQTAGNETVAERNVSGSEITPVLCCGERLPQLTWAPPLPPLPRLSW